jgi:protein-S-isoprenylcysteine O-methyltransferase Ste14
MNILRAVVYLLSTLLLYLGLPLLGWGLDDLAGFFSRPPKSGFALATLLFAAVIGAQALSGMEGLRGGKGDPAKLNRRESAVKTVTVLALYLILTMIPLTDRRGIAVIAELPALQWAGVVLCAAGYAFVFWSGLALGRQYSAEVTIQQDHRLITSGPYRWIRHPRYLGVILLAAGLALVFRSWIGLALLAPITAVMLLRIHDEEELLGREFGPEWQTYQKTSSRLLPGIF